MKQPSEIKKQGHHGSSMENVERRHRTNENKHYRTLPTSFPDTVFQTTPKSKRVSKPTVKTGLASDSKSAPKKASNAKRNVTKSAKSVLQPRKRPVLPSLYSRNREEHNILSGQEIR